MKKIESAYMSHMLGALEQNVPAEQTLDGLDKIGRALRELGREMMYIHTTGAHGAKCTTLQALLYERVHGEHGSIVAVDDWVIGLHRRLVARRKQERLAERKS